MPDLVIVTWREIKEEIQRRLDALHVKMDSAENDRTLWILQGRAQQAREFLNLQDAILIQRAKEKPE